MSEEALRTLRAKLEEIRSALLTRTVIDDEGRRISHEVGNLLVVVDPRYADRPSREDLVELTDRTARVHEAFRRWSATPHPELFADRYTPTPEAMRAMRVALRGPTEDDGTMVPCPACSCELCSNTRLVTTNTAEQWRRLMEE